MKIEKRIDIAAPVEEVFAYTSKPEHLPEYYTGVLEVTDVRRLPNGGYSCKSVNKVAGLRMDVMAETVEFVPNERLVSRGHSTLADVTITVLFERLEGTKTRITCIEEYTIHGGFLGKLGEPVLTKYLDHAAEMTQLALKARMEAGIPAALPR